MTFPRSITGRLTVRRSELTPNSGVMERLAAALSAQTVDSMTIANDTIEFVPQVKGSGGKSRPEGSGWMFNSLGTCLLHIRQEQDGVVVSYRLECGTWFLAVTIFCVASGLLIHLYHGPDSEWGWIFSLGIWTVMFLSGYVSKIIEFRGWLRKNLTSLELPPTKPLSVPKDPD